MRFLVALLGLLCLVVGASVAETIPSASGKPAVHELDDLNFDDLTVDGPWLIVVYAHWCQHCRNLLPVLDALPEPLKQHNVSVGKIDGDVNRILARRFHVEALPSIFLIKNGNTWEYKGSRSPRALTEWASHLHAEVEPWPLLKSPVSFIGRLRGRGARLPLQFKEGYHAAKAQGYSDLTMVAAVLAVPVLVGLGLLVTLDVVAARRARKHAEQERLAAAKRE
ncbi:unnamed protein product [Pedinophyceae sp. YPF-701]|nr:unnamed protein product [Pedinophyceae sp. YPF-701]